MDKKDTLEKALTLLVQYKCHKQTRMSQYLDSAAINKLEKRIADIEQVIEGIAEMIEEIDDAE